MARIVRKTTLAIVALAAAAGLTPPPKVAPSAWAAENLIVPDGPLAGSRWSLALTPFWAEPLDCLSPDSPVNEVAIRKSAQTGWSQVAQAMVGVIIDLYPANALYVLPTVPAAREFNQEKLQPTLDDTPALAGKVVAQTSRSADGSSSRFKKFPGGWLRLAGANSAADLRAKTVKIVIGDEIDEYPRDLDGQGSPLEMMEARQMSFLRFGGWKRILGSTPTMDGDSAIETAFLAGDQRFWTVTCPQCGEDHRFEWENLQYQETFPHKTVHVCPHCGMPQSEADRLRMVPKGRWAATAPGPGKPRSYHLDTLTSPLVPMDEIVAKFLESQGDVTKLKTFYNLWLGRVFKVEGDAPPAENLFDRRSDYADRTVPYGGLVLTAGADVQKDRIECEVVAYGPGHTSWQVAFFVIDGDTQGHEVWAKFAKEVYTAEFPDHAGKPRRIEMLAIDSNYRSDMVYQFVRNKADAMAIRGMGKDTHPVLGTPAKRDILANGRKIGAVMQWPVGTWQLKAAIFGRLSLQGPTENGGYPAGWCFYPKARDLAYFQNLTSEKLVESITRRGVKYEWVRDTKFRNEPLDCRVYAEAAAERLGIFRWTVEDWKGRAALWETEPVGAQLDLLDEIANPTRPDGTRANAVRDEDIARYVAQLRGKT